VHHDTIDMHASYQRNQDIRDTVSEDSKFCYAQGFEAQGNEFSYYMLIASAFVLNGMDAPRQWTVFPWAHSSCNQPSDADQLRPVRRPTCMRLARAMDCCGGAYYPMASGLLRISNVCVVFCARDYT